jgi:adenine-specific DNA methylase/very-short-patch-repair endonuclease
VHDPFAGGGSIPLEAQRLGLEAYASDLNPVAVTINKAMIEIPPKFRDCPPVNPQDRQQLDLNSWYGAQGLAADVRYYGQWMREQAQRRIGHLYPPITITPELAADRPDLRTLIGQQLTVIAWLWARTVKSPNPAFAHVDVPLVTTFILSSKPGNEAYVEPIVAGDTYRFTVRVGAPPEWAKQGTKLGGGGSSFFCLLSKIPIGFDYIRSEAMKGRMGQRLMAIVAEGSRGRVYLPPTAEHESIAKSALPSWKPETPLPEKALGFRVQLYGMKTYGDLFTPRQLVALTTFADLVGEAIEKVKQDAMVAFAHFPHPTPPPLGEGRERSLPPAEEGGARSLPPAGEGEEGGLSPAGGGEEGGEKAYWQPTPVPSALLQAARALRKNMTHAEQLLWQCLRGKQLDSFRFRKQHPIERYVLDFYCPSARLAIEVDGSQHYTSEGRAKDAARTAWLAERGIRVLRFTNQEVLTNLEGVLTVIWEALHLPPPGEGQERGDRPSAEEGARLLPPPGEGRVMQVGWQFGAHHLPPPGEGQERGDRPSAGEGARLLPPPGEGRVMQVGWQFGAHHLPPPGEGQERGDRPSAEEGARLLPPPGEGRVMQVGWQFGAHHLPPPGEGQERGDRPSAEEGARLLPPPGEGRVMQVGWQFGAHHLPPPGEGQERGDRPSAEEGARLLPPPGEGRVMQVGWQFGAHHLPPPGGGREGGDLPLHQGGTGATAYAQAVGVYLALALDRLAMTGNNLVRWNGVGEKAQHCFGRQALPMIWDFAEPNFLASATGSIEAAVFYACDPLNLMNASASGFADQVDAQSQTISSGKVISTDPPYYDNIGYADLSDFFYVWLRRTLRPIFPDLYATLSTPKAEELVATPYRHGSKQAAERFFMDGMTRALHNLAEQAHPAFPVTIYYAFKQHEVREAQRDESATGELGDPDPPSSLRSAPSSTGWETFLEAVIQAGFAITGTWPMHTEMRTRQIAMNTNALASSIVLVCRPRPADVPIATRREFLAALKAELPAALAALQRANIAPVDLAQAAIGPGMAIYTRYARVVDAQGNPVRVREALALINQVLDEVLAEQEGDFDADTRWALAWFEQHGFAEGDFGVAETLSKAKNTSIEGLAGAGILEAKRGRVRLLKPAELTADWDPARDTRFTHWEAVHHLIRVLETGGEMQAAEMAAKLGSRADVARELAYRLYTICERKKRPDDAFSYNALVQSWGEIGRLALDRRSDAPVQMSFEE